MTDDTRPTITPIDDPTGLRLRDPIEGTQFTLLTDEPVEPTPADSDVFPAPIDTAASITVHELATPFATDIVIRDGDANFLAEYVSGNPSSFDSGEYYIDVLSANLKLYLRVDGKFEIDSNDDSEKLKFPDTPSVTVGIRSLHERPAATIQTTDEPSDIATALSHLGTALKTTSCERSYPTLRGHPPLIERGPELSVPDAISPPETDITIQVPPRLDALYTIASLAYYLGAAVEIGDEPLLVVDGEPIPLAGEHDLETTAARVLKQVLVLDCVTRTEGLYEFELHERRVVEESVDFDFARLYNLQIGEQVREYLSVSYDAISDAVPTWEATADVVPEPEHLSVLPFLADDLAVIRCPEDPVTSESYPDLPPEIRSIFNPDPTVGHSEGIVRSGIDSARPTDTQSPKLTEPLVKLDQADSFVQTYVGEGIPIGASKMEPGEYYRRLEFEPRSDQRIRVLVICNDSEMQDENAVSDIYGKREWIEFDIATYNGVGTEELVDLLKEQADLLHYVGHVDDQGIRCVDGHLDARTLNEMNVKTFLLNACTSYQQGRALVDAGALGGIVTLTDVLNPTATEIGSTVARFLNLGYTLHSMMDLVKKRNSLANWYMVVGDGNATLVQNEAGTPNLATIERTGDDFHVDITGLPSQQYRLGALSRSLITESNTRYINSGSLGTFEVSASQLEKYLEEYLTPVLYDGSMYWSDEIQIEEL